MEIKRLVYERLSGVFFHADTKIGTLSSVHLAWSAVWRLSIAVSTADTADWALWRADSAPAVAEAATSRAAASLAKCKERNVKLVRQVETSVCECRLLSQDSQIVLALQCSHGLLLRDKVGFCALQLCFDCNTTATCLCCCKVGLRMSSQK